MQTLAGPAKAPDPESALPRRRDSGLVGVAAFTLDPGGLVVSWSATAASLFGQTAAVVLGRHVCDVLLTGPGHRALADRALARASAGEVHVTTVAGGSLGEGRFALQWEPAAGADNAVLVMARRAWPPPVPGWLREAAARIGGSLDLAQTALQTVEAGTSGFADVAVVYAAERLLAADDRTLPRSGAGIAVRRLAARMAAEDDAVTASLLPPGEVLYLRAGSARAQAMTEGEPVLSSRLDGSAATYSHPHSPGDMVAARYTSFLIMPLISRHVTVGCAVFARTEGSPPFTPDDIMLAGDLAARAAASLDNARLYERERRTALALQRGLLPGEPAVPPGIEVAHVYLPVGDSVVGGDWHDVVPLPDGRVALLTGDAMGHGPEAAAVMVQLRTAAHTLAAVGLPPPKVLGRLDAMAEAMEVADAQVAVTPYATCVCVVIDPVGGTAEITRAGHPPPVIARPGRPAEIPGLPAGLPLGLGTGSFHAAQVALPPGAVLALYTDGLVESRTRPIDDGLAALREALATAVAQPGSSLDDACMAVVQALGGHGGDDVTLMLVRIRG